MAAKISTPEQAEEFIREMRDTKKMRWELITDGLEKAGYKSPRTGRILTMSAIRYIYNYGTAPTHRDNKGGAAGENRLLLIRNVLSIKAPPEQKLQMIEQLLPPVD